MREIKFRGKRFDNNHDDWIYGYLHIIDTYGEGYTGKAIQQQCGTSRPYSVRVNSESVGEYTGLKDKNGKEIYEGDVIKQEYTAIIKTDYDPVSYGLIDQETEEGHHIGEVVIIASKGVCMRKPLRYSLEDDKTEISNQYKNVAGYRCEVIGNVYDNPDLIQKAD